MAGKPRASCCTAHCVRCDLCFAGDSAFDAHLGGEKHDWQHLDPREVFDREGDQRLERRPGGECRTGPELLKDRDIWGQAGARERLAAIHG
jgi:hypothetical protein